MQIPCMAATPHKRIIGWRLRVAIEALGMNYTEAGELFGVSKSKLGNWMRGDDYPAPYFIERFCDRFGVTADWIYRGEVSGISGELADILWGAAQASEAASQGAAVLVPDKPTNRRSSSKTKKDVPAEKSKGPSAKKSKPPTPALT